MTHHVPTIAKNFQGCFSRDRAPILTINPGDIITCSTLDAGWNLDPFANDVFHKAIKTGRVDPANDTGHCLIGPIAVRGARPGQTLVVEIRKLVPSDVGWSWTAGDREFTRALGIDGQIGLAWRIDAASGVATEQAGHRVRIAPFLGVIGVAPAEPGIHSTTPPRKCGGNIDCKELVVGSKLFLPVQVDQALLAFGDGHAAQGDGEVSGTAIECGFEEVELRVALRDDMPIEWPQAQTPAGWIMFGFDTDLRAATVIALNAMLDRMVQVMQIDRLRALALASVVVDLRVTQVVNESMGVHAFWPAGVLAEPAGTDGPQIHKSGYRG